MKNIFILILILPLNLFCQEDIQTDNKKIAIGVNYSIDRTFKSPLKSSLEIPSINYSIGLNLNYSLSKKISIETGLLFANLGYKTKELTLDNSFILDPRRGFPVDPNNIPITEQLIVDRYYLNIPIYLNFYLFGTKTQFYISGGFSIYNFLWESNYYKIGLSDGSDDVTSKEHNTYITKSNLAFGGSFGLDYNFMNNFLFRINPFYKRFITPVKNNSQKEYWYSYGINFGVYFKF